MHKSILFFFSVGLIALFSCNKENISTNPGCKLTFSCDTLSFDTVFSSIGSTTKWFTVKNQNKVSVEISSLRLAGAENSAFRLNVNGISEYQQSNIKIDAGDSVFVEVTVDPTGEDAPMVLHDSIVFNVNGNFQEVDLLAFGQDFHLFNGEIIKTQHWKNDKPYLIYNSVLVDSLETLTIDPGCRIHFHKGSSLFVKGTLNVNGTLKEQIVFQGDRLEDEYENVPGQWGASTITETGTLHVFGGIHFLVGSKNNIINYAVIKNADKGIQVDSLGLAGIPMLTISNSRIENMTLNCLDARTAEIVAGNCVFTNSGSYCVALLFGGNYEFYHCTIANYYGLNTRKVPSLLIKNFFVNNSINRGYDSYATFGNCIIYGSNTSEIVFDIEESNTFEYSFNNCLLKTGNGATYTGKGFEDCIFDADPKFIDYVEFNYGLDSLSPARNAGDAEFAKKFPEDIHNNNRLEDEGPDIGAFEWIPATE